MQQNYRSSAGSIPEFFDIDQLCPCKFKLRDETKKIIWCNYKRGAWNHIQIMVENNLKHVLNFYKRWLQFLKISLYSNTLNAEMIPNCWCGHRETTLSKIELIFRNKKLFGNK